MLFSSQMRIGRETTASNTVQALATPGAAPKTEASACLPLFSVISQDLFFGGGERGGLENELIEEMVGLPSLHLLSLEGTDA